MTKAVFRPGEISVSDAKIFLAAPTSFPEFSHFSKDDSPEELPLAAEEYTGPTVDDLRREADEFRERLEAEREAMISSAKLEAQRIIKEAEEAAFKEVKRRTDDAQAMKSKAQIEAEKIIADAQTMAKKMESDAYAAFENERKEAEEQGRASGHELGFSAGKAEVERLIQRSQVVLQRAQDKRTEILEETEQEIISLVLLIARKVIKVISENQKNVIISNVVQALRKVKGRGNILIRVNVNDLRLATDHIKDFINLVEGAKSVQLIEDSAVDDGGCIIETDFGEIDARIASQLVELENKILEISPIRSVAKSAPEITGG